jgi:hypothetical protein
MIGVTAQSTRVRSGSPAPRPRPIAVFRSDAPASPRAPRPPERPRADATAKAFASRDPHTDGCCASPALRAARSVKRSPVSARVAAWPVTAS